MKARLGIGLVVGLCLSAGSLMPVVAQEDACYAKNGVWQSDTQKCVMNSGVHVAADYPLEFTDYPNASSVIDAFLLDQQKSFIASYTPDYALPSYANDWTMNISYEPYQYKDTVRSVVFNMSFYTGGAHPNSGYKSFNFDVAQDAELTLADLFVNGAVPYDTLSGLVQADLKTQLGDMSDASMIEAGAGNNPDNYQSWVITDEGLTFFFDPYQVAAYAAGPQQVTIPFSTLNGLLKAEFAG